MTLTLIAALDRNNAIGRGNALPWHLPGDLKRFKALTLGKSVLMGRKTAESIGRPLPGRRNLVLSRNLSVPFGEHVTSVEEACERIGNAELMVIGGGEIYRATLALASRLYLTEVKTLIDDADTFFPRFNRSEWVETARTYHPVDAQHEHSFSFVDYKKR